MINGVEAQIIINALTSKGNVEVPKIILTNPEMVQVLKAIATMRKVMKMMDEQIQSNGGEKEVVNFLRWRKCFNKMPNVNKGQRRQFLVKLKDGSVTTDFLILDDKEKKRWESHGYNVVKWCKIPPEDDGKEQKK